VITARQLFFGAENVDARSGEIDHDKVIFSWITNASLAVSIKGHVVLLDTFVHRPETAPGRTPFVMEDLLNLLPEALFLGHGHFDHADNAAFLSSKLKVPIYASAETCVAMQNDATKYFTAGVLSSSTVDCRDTTSAGSTPGSEIVSIGQLEPLVSITAFRHLHSTTTPLDHDFPIVVKPSNSSRSPPSPVTVRIWRAGVSSSSTGKRGSLPGAVDCGKRSRAFSTLAGRSEAVEKLWSNC